MPRGIWEVFKEFGIALGTDIAFKKFTSTAADKAAGHVAEKVFADKRAGLLADMMVGMDSRDTDNIWRWYQETPRDQENRFPTLLCKLPEESRCEIIATLNRLPDREAFEVALRFLEHDPVAQFVNRQANRAVKTARKATASINLAAKEAVPEINRLNRRLKRAVQRAKAKAQGGP